MQRCLFSLKLVNDRDFHFVMKFTHSLHEILVSTETWIYMLSAQNTEESIYYILEASNFDFRYVRLCDLDIPREI